ncbi:hypothetical protein GF354_03370 [Candidatus Peregrinibacteria bacterium]|nr:hypothetical protein [Candidatus Peregrinibacteria bacterium]
MKKIITMFLSFILLAPTTFASFSDVPQTHHLYKSITWLENAGVVEGYYDGTFRPDADVNRVEFLKMLFETMQQDSYHTVLKLFPDVPRGEWYTKYVEEAITSQIVDGYPDGTFRPDNPINFAEAVKIVTNAFFDVDKLYGTGANYYACNTVGLDEYPSVDTDQWYWKYLHVADELCILNFDSTANIWETKSHRDVFGMIDYDPATELSRGDMAEFLYRALVIRDNELDKYESSYIPTVTE